MLIDVGGRSVIVEKSVQLAILTKDSKTTHLFRYEEEGQPTLLYIVVEATHGAVNIGKKTGTDQVGVPFGVPTSVINPVSIEEAQSIYSKAQRKIGIWADVSNL